MCDEIEIYQMEKQFDETKLSDEPELTPEESQQQKREEKLKILENENMIITVRGEVIEMPSKNKNCPCNSKKKYKKCCYTKD